MQDYGEESLSDTEELGCTSKIQTSKESIQLLNEEIERQVEQHS